MSDVERERLGPAQQHAAERELPESSSSFGGIATVIGAPLLQRKLAQRLARKSSAALPPAVSSGVTTPHRADAGETSQDDRAWDAIGGAGVVGVTGGAMLGTASSTGSKPTATPKHKLNLSGVVAAGGPLNDATIDAVNKASKKEKFNGTRYVVYADMVRIGGSLAWRANNPGNLRDAPTKIALVPGGSGKFAVFASLEEGRAAQRALYLNSYGAMKVRDAINKLTPPSENDTERYLKQLQAGGVDLDKTVDSQIDLLMVQVQTNEGLIRGTEVSRQP